jgi:hypothetical protein
MKLEKPIYDSSAKVYSCKISDGFRFSAKHHGGGFTSDPTKEIDSEVLANEVIQLTGGWFSKPLTQDFLKGKLKYNIPTSDIQPTFEGEVEFQMNNLLISKDTFLFICTVISVKEDEKICIVFPEEDAEVPPLNKRKLQKEKAMLLRTKAARALFHAERLTQEYCSEFGEDTDWEDEE